MKISKLTAALAAGAALASPASAAFAEPQPTPPGPQPPAAYKVLARDILKELIEIDSTHAKGSTVAAQAVARRALHAGFSPIDVVVLAPPERPSKGNVVIRLHGKGLGKPLLIIDHLDVVEANREDWTTDPFTLVEKDGYFYGRGTEDMKGEDAVLLTALIRLKHEGYVPDRDIIAAFTADEEAGGDSNGPQWLLAKHRDLVEAGLSINQDGEGGQLRNGKRLYIGVETSEKLYATYELQTTDRGGHSSVPRDDNAIYQLTEGLNRLEHYQFPPHLTATTRAYFGKIAALESGQTRADMLAVAAETPDPAAAARLSRDPVRNALLRTTCVATVLKAGQGESALPERANATVQCRLMPGETPEETLTTLKLVLGDPAIKVTTDGPIDPSPETLLTADVAHRYQRAADAMWPRSLIIPTMAAGASDSVYPREAGMASYVSGAIFADLDDPRAHGRDERIGVTEFYEGVEYMDHLLKSMSAKD
jgi:acetylornithine deacetylase/succinyl-diaminopimelate desuccinylase-like protein